MGIWLARYTRLLPRGCSYDGVAETWAFRNMLTTCKGPGAARLIVIDARNMFKSSISRRVSP